MTIDSYIKERVDNQINWYDSKSKIFKAYTLISKFSIILLSASIPFLVEMMHHNQEVIKEVIFVFALLIGIITGVSSFMKLQEKWYSYRTTCESLKHQKFLFLTESGHFQNNENKNNEFVLKVERIISKENSEWDLILDEE